MFKTLKLIFENYFFVSDIGQKDLFQKEVQSTADDPLKFENFFQGKLFGAINYDIKLLQ